MPILGPLSSVTGTFTYRDATGAVTSTPGAVRVIEAWLRGVTESGVSSGYDQRQVRQDSIRVRIRLRNAS